VHTNSAGLPERKSLISVNSTSLHECKQRGSLRAAVKYAGRAAVKGAGRAADKGAGRATVKGAGRNAVKGAGRAAVWD